MIKKLYIALLLSLGCVSQAVADETVMLATDITPTNEYTGYALLADDGKTITASIADWVSTINTLIPTMYSTGQYYLRWFVHEKSDTDAYSVYQNADVTLSMTTGTTICQDGYGIWVSLNYYYVFSSDFSDAIIQMNNALDSETVGNYQVICLLTDNNGYVRASTDWTNYTITETSFIASFTFDIMTIEEMAASYDFPDLSSVTNTHEEILPYTNGATSMTVDLSDYYNQIISDINSTTSHGVNYLHFYLLDSDDEPLTNAYSSGFITYQYTQMSSNEDTLTTSTGYYAYYTPEGQYDTWIGVFNQYNNDDATKMSYTLTLPSGYDWDDIKLVAVLSKSTDGLSIIEDIVVSEPTTLESAFIFSFVQSGVFRHYKGWAYEGKEAEWDTKSGHEMQYTHEYSFEKFVAAGETVDMKLPIESGNDTEPRGYHRWYDYNTDAASSYLVNTTYGTDLKHFPDETNSAGLMAYATSNRLSTRPTWENWAAVQFQAPSDNWSKESDGQVIACDQSRYVDGIAGGELIHEPTLSMRYKFYVYPTSVCADRLKNAIIDNPVSGIYEDYGYVVLGEKSSSVVFNLRTELHKIKDYYFYNYTKSETKITDSTADVSDAFGSDICNATELIWRVIDPSGNYYKDFQTINAEYPILSLTRDMLNNNGTWTLLTDGTASGDTFSYTFTNTSLAYIVVYASDGTNRCPIARYTCRFAEEYPIAFDELPENRTLEYLKENYTHVAEVNFDNLDTEHTSLAAPTSPADNQNYLPTSGWNKRFYGFVYYDLYDKMCEQDNTYIIDLSCLHGDYCIYKSINLSGVSVNKPNNDYQYHWWLDTPTLYDRTYANTNGSQYGYFLYTDASQEQRQMAEVDFDGDLCAGSVIVVSMAVASYTSQTTKPQVMFKLYGIEEDANGEETSRKLLQSFASGDFDSQKCSDQGIWYQVFVKTSLQESTGVENYSKFAITIDNYCGNTQGADYCIDDIHVFMKNSKVEVAQQDIPCSTSQTTTTDLKIRMDYEALMAWIGSDTGWDTSDNSKTLYWRIIDSDGNVVTGLYGEGNEYGSLKVYNTYAANDSANIAETDSYGIEYIIIASNLAFTQESGKTYYVSLGKKEDGDTEISWGSPTDICSAYSDYFEILTESINITSGGEMLSSLPLTCGTRVTMNLAASMKIPDPVNGGTMTLSGLSYTWQVVVYTAQGDSTIYDLNSGTATPDSLSFTYDEKYLSDDGYIYFKLTLATSEYTIYAGTTDETTVYLCTDPIIVALKVTSVGPELNLGFSDVTYAAGTTRTVRVGLEQLNDMVTDSKKLVIPLHSYSSVNGSTSFDMTLQDEGKLTISDTNDPTCTVGTTVGTASDMTYDDTTKSINLQFNSNAISSFHEGYWYELNFVIGETYNSSTCKADVFFTMKIVPEYVTWTGADNHTMSTNWNNDLNWERSAADYIYKTSDYEDYGVSGGSYENLTTQQAYVPMKFTKVTIDPNIQSARLESLSANSEGIIVSGLMNTEGYSATDDIQYDLMVMVEDELTGTDSDYECEKFYGNTCKEIYFKPEAEIRYQQYLNYDKAWVEYELVPNKWYMLTSPLKEVYAGDMYVPTGSGTTQGRQETEAFVDISFDKSAGYSRTAYPIYQRSWDKESSMVITPTSDSRGDYDAFIKSYTWTGTDDAAMAEAQWSHTYNDVTVPYTPNATDAQNGFSLRANKQAVTNEGTTVNALIRVPKADTQYDYYDYDDGTSGGRTGSVTKSSEQNLLMDNTSNSTSVTMSLSNQSSENGLYLVSNPYMASIDMTRFFGVNTNLTPSFWIVKEGVMHTVDIDFWNLSGLTIPTIAPTQAFFVKLADGATNTESVTFTTYMITKIRVDLSGNILSTYAKYTQAAAAKASVKSVTLTASYDDKTSKAKVVLNADADEDYVDGEDVETVYDSNLADVPTLYTVAGDQAVSVNKLPGISVVPLGIVCSSDVEATVLVTGTSNVEGDLYLIDTQTGASTVLDDSVTVTVTANDHGRYYLSNMSIESVSQRIEDEEGSGIKCYSPSPGLLTVACLAAGDTIETIDLYTVDGKKLQTISNVDNNTTTLNTYKGIKIVVVKHSGNEKAETAKVAVR